MNDVLWDSSANYGEEPDGMLQMYRGGEFGGEHSTSAYLGHYVFTPTV